MDLTIAAPLIVLIALVCSVIAAAIRSPSLFRLALTFFLKKKRLTALTIVGLVVGSAIITGSLAVGDSLRSSVVEEVYANLGGVDEIVHSNGLFRESISTAISGNSTLAGVTDAVAPLLVLEAAVRNTVTGRYEASVNLIGYDASFLAFGEFTSANGSDFTRIPPPGLALINQQLAERLDAVEGAKLSVTTRNPGFSIESIFSPLTGQASIPLTVEALVKDSGLGRFNMESAGGVPENIFVGLGYLQTEISAPSQINTIVVSNKGGVRDGVELTSAVVDRLQAALDDAVGFGDLRLTLSASAYVKVESGNIFFEGRYADSIQSMAGVDGESRLASYFVNSISFQGRKIPYSTVTGLDPASDYQFGPFVDNATGSPVVGDIGESEIILTNYTAARLGAGVGDAVTLNFTTYDATYSPTFVKENFTVGLIVEMVGKAADPGLMPPFPGISGKASCADWDPPWVSGDKMRSEMSWEDLYYWQTYGGTPKAYINLAKAQTLWANDVGNITTVKVAGANVSALVQAIGTRLNATALAGDAGITVAPAKQIGIESAEGTQLLTETFLSFGMVVVASGIILEAALVAGMMEGRKKEIAVLKTLGTKRGQITKTFAFEGFLISTTSAAIGILLGLFVAFACIWLTNTYWSNIVEGRSVVLSFTAETILVGFVAGLMISLVTFVLSARHASAQLISRAFAGGSESPRKEHSVLVFAGFGVTSLILVFANLYLAANKILDPTEEAVFLLASPAAIILGFPLLPAAPPFIGPANRAGMMRTCGLSSVFLTSVLTYLLAGWPNVDPFPVFFVSGFVIVAGAIVFVAGIIRPLGAAVSKLAAGSGTGRATLRIALLSPSRRMRRTSLSIALFAVVIFTYLGLSVNIQGQQQNVSEMMARQGAGYDVFAQSSSPVRFDLGNETERVRNGVVNFSAGTEVVQFLTSGQVGGSCTNLKRNLPPRLIGANYTFTRESTLRFQATAEDRDAHGVIPDWMRWARLDGLQSDGAIPALGDYNTIVWILGKNVGDHLQVVDEHGAERQLTIVGIFENSIFPGSLFVSEQNLNELFPTTAEYRLFLFKTGSPTALVTYLESNLGAYGMDASLVSDIVRDNMSVEWSYMSLFQALLLLGLFIGIVGIAASSSKWVEERRAEIGTMRAMGFKRSMVLNSLVLENLYIASLGAVVGIIAGLVVAFAFFGRGSLLSYSVAVPWLAIVLVVAAVDAAAAVAAISPARKAARMNPVAALRKEQ